jgi:hypothetical protein
MLRQATVTVHSGLFRQEGKRKETVPDVCSFMEKEALLFGKRWRCHLQCKLIWTSRFTVTWIRWWVECGKVYWLVALPQVSRCQIYIRHHRHPHVNLPWRLQLQRLPKRREIVLPLRGSTPKTDWALRTATEKAWKIRITENRRWK